jgi:hypothetical protein
VVRFRVRLQELTPRNDGTSIANRDISNMN